MRPRLLALDEPTEGIQPSIIQQIGAAITTLAERGDMAILLVEQYFDFACELMDEYIVLDRGEGSDCRCRFGYGGIRCTPISHRLKTPLRSPAGVPPAPLGRRRGRGASLR